MKIWYITHGKGDSPITFWVHIVFSCHFKHFDVGSVLLRSLRSLFCLLFTHYSKFIFFFRMKHKAFLPVYFSLKSYLMKTTFWTYAISVSQTQWPIRSTWGKQLLCEIPRRYARERPFLNIAMLTGLLLRDYTNCDL